MNPLNIQQVIQYVEENIGNFHKQRLNSLEQLTLSRVLKKKNPYLFKAKNYLTPESIVKALTDAFLSSNEETIFGDWLEGLAIFINKQVYGGWKSGIKGVDLEFDKDKTRYIVSIKSEPNWGNSSQIEKMKWNFNTAKKTLRTSQSGLSIIAVNGCCYGQDNRPDKGDYFKYCGQVFWKFISGDSELYLKIIEPLGHQAREKNEAFTEMYSAMITRFSWKFAEDFCLTNGKINWEKLVTFNSMNQNDNAHFI